MNEVKHVPESSPQRPRTRSTYAADCRSASFPLSSQGEEDDNGPSYRYQVPASRFKAYIPGRPAIGRGRLAWRLLK